jgi:hypothetical protein
MKKLKLGNRVAVYGTSWGGSKLSGHRGTVQQRYSWPYIGAPGEFIPVLLDKHKEVNIVLVSPNQCKRLVKKKVKK